MIPIFFAPAGANSARLFRQSERRTRGAFCTFSGRLPDLSLRGSAGAVAISGRHCRPTPAIVGARHASPGAAQTIRTGRRENRRNWSARFYRQPVRIGSIAAGGACPSPTTHSWRPSKTIHFPLSTCRARCPGFCNIIPAVLPLPSASGCAGRSRRCGSRSACRLRRHRAGPAGRRRGRPASG